MMLMGYPAVFWLAVGLASGAGAVVFVGVGYLLGLQDADRAQRSLREDLEQGRAEFRARWGGR